MSTHRSFYAARAAEQASRALSYLPKAPALCGVPVVPFTPRHWLELELAGNVLLPGVAVAGVGNAPLLGDVAQFLWRLHPNFRRADGATPNRDPRAPRPTRLASWLARRQVHRVVYGISPRRFWRRCRPGVDLQRAERDIRAFVARAEQDKPAFSGRGEGVASPLLPDRFWLDVLAVHFGQRHGLSPDAVLDTPLALLYQLYREDGVGAGLGCAFIAPSDSLYGKD